MTANALSPVAIGAKVTINAAVGPEPRIRQHRGRAALQGRITRSEKLTRALAPEAARKINGGNMTNRNSQTLGSQTMTEFCEQLNPRILLTLRDHNHDEARRPGREMLRVQESWVAAAEKRALLWLAARTPDRIGPDHLTVLGLLAQIAAGAFYAAAAWNRYALLAVIAFLTLNWLGDSLDGTLARVRQRQRPRYGFYVDHMVDTFGALALMGGLALSGYMHPVIAIGLLIAFLVLSIQSYLATYALGEFRISFWRFGPTELRILLSVGNLALFWKPVVHCLGGKFRLFDAGGVIGLAGMGLMVIAFTAQNTIRLYREERIAQ
jgi:archaetidylinositol phosphate synthase